MAIQLLLLIPGIPGSSTLRGHTDQIEINDFDWGVANTGAEVSFAPLYFTKFIDRASSQIKQAVVSGQQFKEITLFVVQVTDTVEDLVTYSFINNTITEFSQAGSTGFQVVENIAIHFENVTFVFREPSAR